MSIYSDLEQMKLVAMHQAKEHNCNYNVILMNPDENGKFNAAKGSTYEMVADSYFEKERPNCILLHKTDELIRGEKKEEGRIVDTPTGQVKIEKSPEPRLKKFEWTGWKM